MSDNTAVKITKLAAQGDGAAMHDGRPVFVPFTLPGETVCVSGSGNRRKPVSVLEPAPERVEPFCQYFGECGGCQLQHFDHDAYVVWKARLLRRAFVMVGVDIEPAPMVQFDRASRRRAVLVARKHNDAWAVGFAERGSHKLVEIETCPVFTAELNAALSQIPPLLAPFAKVRGNIRIHLLAADNGPDIVFSFDGKRPAGLVRALTTLSDTAFFNRISVNGETVLERQRPTLRIGKALVSPPPGGFVQASAQAEAAMAELVGEHLSGCKEVADLFCGFGTFALRLAENSTLHAVESEDTALQALDRAWRETGGALKTVTHEKRDLFRRPLMVKELKAYQGVVFDPPRAGAEAQAYQMAKSSVRKIAAVSCNPVTLARDVKILTDGGYRIDSITPVDQFAFTPHLETIALLSR